MLYSAIVSARWPILQLFIDRDVGRWHNKGEECGLLKEWPAWQEEKQDERYV